MKLLWTVLTVSIMWAVLRGVSVVTEYVTRSPLWFIGIVSLTIFALTMEVRRETRP